MAVSGTCHRSVSAAGQFSAARHLLRRQKNTSPLGSNFGSGVTDSGEHEPLKIQRMQFRKDFSAALLERSAARALSDRCGLIVGPNTVQCREGELL